jgi:hypothetical protein
MLAAQADDSQHKRNSELTAASRKKRTSVETRVATFTDFFDARCFRKAGVAQRIARKPLVSERNATGAEMPK